MSLHYENVVQEGFATNDSTEKKTKTPPPANEVLPIAVRIFNESHVVHLLWFILIYIVVYVFFGQYLKLSGDVSAESKLSQIFDYVVLFWIVVFSAILYYTSSEKEKENVLQALMDWTIEFYDNPLSIFSVSLFMISFYIIVMILRVPMTHELKPYSVELIESKGWILIVSLLICYFFKYVLAINLMDFFRDPNVSQFWKNTLSDKPVTDTKTKDSKTADSKTTPTTKTTTQKQPEVFNISNHEFSYKEAQSVCKSYDARLATYDEIEKAYNHGAEWCNYGWSADQMGYFPTQKETWAELQKQPSMKNRCGRPGVNGGFIPNPNIKLGINCFGIKPNASSKDKMQMETKYEPNAPKTEEDHKLDELSEYWKNNQDKLSIHSFNRKKWSNY
jgi:hypothetical protein